MHFQLDGADMDVDTGGRRLGRIGGNLVLHDGDTGGHDSRDGLARCRDRGQGCDRGHSPRAPNRARGLALEPLEYSEAGCLCVARRESCYW